MYSVAEASRRGLPYSQEDHSKVVACSREPEPEATAQESLQASAAEWISRSSSYTRHLAKGISHEDWERKLQQMCARGHKGTQGLGAQVVVPRKKSWQKGAQLEPYSVGRYKDLHGTKFVAAKGDAAGHGTGTPEPAWKPVVQEKPMRLPTLDDTARLTELMASVALQEAQREDHNSTRTFTTTSGLSPGSGPKAQ